MICPSSQPGRSGPGRGRRPRLPHWHLKVHSSSEEEELKGAKCWYWKAASEGKHEEVEQLQPNDHDDGDKENVSYGDQLTEQASNRQDENMKQLENNENAPEKVVERQNKVNAEQGESSREPFIGHLE
ncbi:uncharacterized protein LOC124669721 [Lolium rigidum]|uniref:uncharacterized protein LOC124669721 n=1 Tax=Lolium rigidum TaxID=89674 RepID=UPI001F5C4F48|nr:uncharacterized protein LOC124669721 [Lolium rigidum]